MGDDAQRRQQHQQHQPSSLYTFNTPASPTHTCTPTHQQLLSPSRQLAVANQLLLLLALQLLLQLMHLLWMTIQVIEHGGVSIGDGERQTRNVSIAESLQNRQQSQLHSTYTTCFWGRGLPLPPSFLDQSETWHMTVNVLCSHIHASCMRLWGEKVYIRQNTSIRAKFAYEITEYMVCHVKFQLDWYTVILVTGVKIANLTIF